MIITKLKHLLLLPLLTLMDWESAERQWRIRRVPSNGITDDSKGFKSKDPKFELLVPCFLHCYSRIRPSQWDIVIYEWDKKVRKPYSILPLVAALLIKWFNDYNRKFKRITTKDLFIMQWLAFHRDSYYYKQREQEYPGFYRWEMAPEVFLLALNDKDVKHFNHVSIDKYTQYITKSFFRECLTKVFKGVEEAWMSVPPGHRITDEWEAILNFFTEWATVFFSRLKLGKDYLEKNDDEYYEMLQDKRPLEQIQRTLTLILRWVYDDGYEKPTDELWDLIDPVPFDVAWEELYTNNKVYIDNKMYWIDRDKYRYEVE